MKKILSVILIAWFAVVAVTGFQGVFVSGSGAPPLAVGIAFLAPLLVFLGLFFGLEVVRRRLAQIPTLFLISLHSWRFVGLGFIAAEMRGLLPPGFAWPAGLGDISIAVVAPYLVYRLGRDERFRAEPGFVLWNIFGIADFVIAVGLGIAHQVSPQTFHAAVDTRMMQELPFVLIPCFFVPLLGMTHVVLLYQSYQARQASRNLFANTVKAVA